MEKHTGDAEHMKSGGSDESSPARQNSPFRELHHGGHMLNHLYKNPVASPMGLENHSYMSPIDHGKGMTPPAPPKTWGKPDSIKPMAQQGAGKSGPPRIS